MYGLDDVWTRICCQIATTTTPEAPTAFTHTHTHPYTTRTHSYRQLLPEMQGSLGNICLWPSITF